ncbi:MAG: lysophospholipase [Verrucomicrobia bacterium]|nr:lysophospholipase [Verrucomicrobiota bacterium]
MGTFKLTDASTWTDIRSRDGTKLFCRQWRIGSAARGSILLVPGLGEQSGRYLHVGDFFRQAGFEVIAIDLRGHGRSAGPRGYVERYGDFLDDARAAISLAKAHPLLVLGHSFGGQLALALASRKEPNIAGYITSAPWLGLTSPPAAWLVGLGALSNIFVPKHRFATGLESKAMSTDQAHLDSLADLDLDHCWITARAYFEITAEARRLLKHPSANAPVLIAHGDVDQVTSTEAARAFFKVLKAPAKELKIYQGYLHELHNEIGRERVLQDYLDWIEKVVFAVKTG